MSSITFERKVRNMTRDNLETLVYEMESQLLSVIDDEAKVDESGEILPADQQMDHTGEIMRLIDF